MNYYELVNKVEEETNKDDLPKLGSCMLAAEELTRKYLSQGITDFEVIEGWVTFKGYGYASKTSHTWIKRNGKIEDPTKRQFMHWGFKPEDVRYTKILHKYTPQEYLALCKEHPVKEETTSAAVAFIPGGFKSDAGAVRKKMFKKPKKMNLNVKEASAKVLLGDCRNEDLINDIFGSVSEFARQVDENGDNFIHGDIEVIYMPVKDIHQFWQISDTKNESILAEAIEQELASAKDKLLKQIDRKLNAKDIYLIDRSANIFRSLFGVSEFDTPRNVAIKYESKKADVRDFKYRIREDYNDIGNIELLTAALENGDSLASYDVFSSYDSLYGTTIKSKYKGIYLTYEVSYDMNSTMHESVFVRDEEVIDVLEDSKNFRMIKGLVFPVKGRFTKADFLVIRNTIKGIDDDED